MATKRLRKELTALQTDPPPDIIAEPDDSNILVWHYAMRGPPTTDYEGGVYVGKLKFPPNYPMAPPAVMMLTPSGRFQINTRLCMSMSDFHPESWNPMWSVGTILQGIVSFMTSEEVTTGGLQASSADRKKLAQVSQAYNAKHWNHLFDGNMSAAFEKADQARQKAESKRLLEAEKTRAAALIKANATCKPKAEETPNVSAATEQSPTEELTEEQKEKRRLKNAKKRAKQKAKKAAQASNDNGEQEEVAEDAE